MKNLILTILFTLFLGASAAWGQCRDAGNIKFPHGRTSTTLTGSITSTKAVCYHFHARKGQTVTASLKSASPRARFSIAPDAEDTDEVVADTTSYVGKLDTAYSDKYVLSIHVPKGTATYTLKVDIK